MPRVQSVVIPILREAFPGVKVGSWVEDIDYRMFPMLNVRRLGGRRDAKRPQALSLPVVELTAYGIAGLVETEQL
jgi:hypothetical protein